MIETPSQKQIVEAVGISQSYASMILAGTRTPPEELAIRIFRATGWKPPRIANLSSREIETLEALKAKAAA